MSEEEQSLPIAFRTAMPELRLAPDEVAPLRPEEVDLDRIRQILQESGFNLEPGPEAIDSLGQRQFRNLEFGRGPGVVAVMGELQARK